MTIFLTSFPFFLLSGLRFFFAYLSCFFVLTSFHVFLLDLPSSLFPNFLFIFFSPYIVYFIDTKTDRTSPCLLIYSVIQSAFAESEGCSSFAKPACRQTGLRKDTVALGASIFCCRKRGKTIQDEKFLRMRIPDPALD